MTRRLQLKMFIGSTVEAVEQAFNAHFTNLCPGNLIRTELHCHGGVYQYEVLYAEVTQPQPGG